MPSPATTPLRIRSLYRSLLRELPPLSTTTRKRTQLHNYLRSTFSSPSSDTPEKGQQALTYLRSQRLYAMLLERYNPSLGIEGEGDRVRMSARRVGFEVPKEFGEGRKQE